MSLIVNFAGLKSMSVTFLKIFDGRVVMKMPLKFIETFTEK